MGLFSKRKKHPQKTDDDYDVFSFSGLVEFVKDNLDNPTKENVTKAVLEIVKPDKDQKHLTKDGELPWGWLSKNTPICKPYEDKMVQLAVDLKGIRDPEERIAQLEKLVASYYDFKRFCYSKDECFIKYFSDMWEHCYNSKHDVFEYITPYLKELTELKANKATLNKEYERKMVALDNLDEKIAATLRDNDGILQSDFVKLFDYTVHTEVRDKLYHMAQAEQIVRVKSGKSYILYIKKA